MADPVDQLKSEISTEFIEDTIQFYEEMRKQIIKALRAHGQHQVENYHRDSKNIRDLYSRFIHTLPSAFDAMLCLGAGSRKAFNERFRQQFKLRIQIDESKPAIPLLIQTYLDIAKYRDLVEQIIDFLRPFARHLDLLSASKKSEERFQKCKTYCDKGRPPLAKEILDRIHRLGAGLLDEVINVIDHFVRNAFSQVDYLIDEERDCIHLYSLEEERKWMKRNLDVKKSTVWLYFQALYIEWILTVFPLLKQEKELGQGVLPKVVSEEGQKPLSM